MVKKAKAFSQYYFQHLAFLCWLCTCTQQFLKEFCCVSPPSDKNIKLCRYALPNVIPGAIFDLLMNAQNGILVKD